jgi:hypothetical protein
VTNDTAEKCMLSHLTVTCITKINSLSTYDVYHFRSVFVKSDDTTEILCANFVSMCVCVFVWVYCHVFSNLAQGLMWELNLLDSYNKQLQRITALSLIYTLYISLQHTLLPSLVVAWDRIPTMSSSAHVTTGWRLSQLTHDGNSLMFSTSSRLSTRWLSHALTLAVRSQSLSYFTTGSLQPMTSS